MATELSRQEAQELHRSNLASAGELAAGVAHDMVSPLTSAISLLEMAIEALQPSVVAHDLSFARDQLDRVRRLAMALLGLCRAPAQGLDESVELGRVAADAARLLAGRHRSRVSIEVDAPPGLPLVRGSFALLLQVAVNLVDNAAKFALGRVRISVALGTGDRQGMQALHVEDDGPGIPEPMRKEVFEPFFTTSPVGEGTGLGLSICKTIADRHGATCEVGTSSLGGARLTLWMPPP